MSIASGFIGVGKAFRNSVIPQIIMDSSTECGHGNGLLKTGNGTQNLKCELQIQNNDWVSLSDQLKHQLHITPPPSKQRGLAMRPRPTHQSMDIYQTAVAVAVANNKHMSIRTRSCSNISPLPSIPFSYMPSSMPTLLHHGLSALSANISSKSPTCLLSLTSLLSWPDSFNFIALLAKKGLPLRERVPYVVPCVNPWDDERVRSLDAHPSLMTGNCYWRGSDEDERRLRCR